MERVIDKQEKAVCCRRKVQLLLALDLCLGA